MRLSLILAVLDSHEALRRQLLHLKGIMPPESELIVVDDGSRPQIEIAEGMDQLVRTHDFRAWTQPRARNLGADEATSDMLLFFDMDQILTRELLSEAAAFTGNVMLWNREPGRLDQSGSILQADGKSLGPHLNSLAISRHAFESVGGYDERFCGEYGYFDIYMTQQLKKAGFASEMAEAKGIYWTEKTIPATHGLARVDSKRNAALLGTK